MHKEKEGERERSHLLVFKQQVCNDVMRQWQIHLLYFAFTVYRIYEEFVFRQYNKILFIYYYYRYFFFSSSTLDFHQQEKIFSLYLFRFYWLNFLPQTFFFCFFVFASITSKMPKHFNKILSWKEMKLQ